MWLKAIFIKPDWKAVNVQAWSDTISTTLSQLTRNRNRERDNEKHFRNAQSTENIEVSRYLNNANGGREKKTKAFQNDKKIQQEMPPRMDIGLWPNWETLASVKENRLKIQGVKNANFCG